MQRNYNASCRVRKWELGQPQLSPPGLSEAKMVSNAKKYRHCSRRSSYRVAREAIGPCEEIPHLRGERRYGPLARLKTHNYLSLRDPQYQRWGGERIRQNLTPPSKKSCIVIYTTPPHQQRQPASNRTRSKQSLARDIFLPHIHGQTYNMTPACTISPSSPLLPQRMDP